MRRRKLAVALVIALALAPGTLVRTAIPKGPVIDLTVTPLADLPDARQSGGFHRLGAWELNSPRIDFGGYSALLVPGGKTLRAFSDRGNQLTFTAPDQPLGQEVRSTFVWNRGEFSNTLADIEAATRDPVTSDYWLAFENSNAVIRYTIASELGATRAPPEWQGWPENSGAEAMARLPDGAFLVLPERSTTGFLYPSDPTGDVEPVAFEFAVPGGYHPTDMAALPDGRVLVLLRQVVWSVPPFATAIALADPRDLADGDTLDLTLLVELEAILPRENYEALALAGVAKDGTVQLWLMSDDNLSAFQRTLLAKLSWREPDAAHEKAREEP